MSKPPMIYLKEQEYAVIQMALAGVLEDLKKMEEQPWDPTARKYHRDMTEAAKSAALKIEKVTGIKAELPPYFDGDENQFFTKES